MPRAPRHFVDRAFYHVYARIARGERVFTDHGEAARLLKILGDVKRRDGWTVFAWCVMPTHYHLALRPSSVALWRSMRLVQWCYPRERNLARRQLGPLWQGRYQARLVSDERYLLQLIASIHLDPVVAGLARDPAEYRWSGHHELLGRSSDPLVNVDATLGLFSEQRSQARSVYVRALGGERERTWVGEDVDALPWWTGREAALDDGAWDAVHGLSVAHETMAAQLRDADEYLDHACCAIGIGRRAVASRSTACDVARAREPIAVVGVERYDVRVGELAKALGMHLGSVSRWITRAAARRLEDQQFALRCEQLEQALDRS